jgi:hypothetical protein
MSGIGNSPTNPKASCTVYGLNPLKFANEWVWVWSLSLHVVFSILHELSAILQAFQAKA